MSLNSNSFKLPVPLVKQLLTTKEATIDETNSYTLEGVSSLISQNDSDAPDTKLRLMHLNNKSPFTLRAGTPFDLLSNDKLRKVQRD